MKEKPFVNDASASYHEITETPGLQATREQVERIYHRYRFAGEYARQGNVLEVACGGGIGLGYLAGKAKKVVGGDIDKNNLATAARIYGSEEGASGAANRLEIVWLDAHDLKFPDGFFDLVLLYEAIYYLRDPELFVKEAKRVLKGSGNVIICTVNKDWSDFHPSPLTYRYYSVPELSALLRRHFRCVNMFGAFPAHDGGRLAGLISLIKRTAVHLDLIPGSLAARAYLKRIFLGRLTALPEQVHEDMAKYEPPVAIPDDCADYDYKIIYAVATDREAR